MPVSSHVRVGPILPRMPDAEVTLPGATSSVPAARRFVESVLSSWGQPDLGWAAAMCVSELAGNCALHARTRFTVRVVLEDGLARIEVSDGSFQAPAQRSYGVDATTGRGLRIVAEYASDWGIDMTANGKTVWVVLRADDAGSGLVHDDAGEADLDALLVSLGEDADDARGTASSELLWQVAA